MRILVTARASMFKDRTRSINALNALVRGNALGIDARKKLTGAQIAGAANDRWDTMPCRAGAKIRAGTNVPTSGLLS